MAIFSPHLKPRHRPRDHGRPRFRAGRKLRCVDPVCATRRRQASTSRAPSCSLGGPATALGGAGARRGRRSSDAWPRADVGGRTCPRRARVRPTPVRLLEAGRGRQFRSHSFRPGLAAAGRSGCGVYGPGGSGSGRAGGRCCQAPCHRLFAGAYAILRAPCGPGRRMWWPTPQGAGAVGAGGGRGGAWRCCDRPGGAEALAGAAPAHGTRQRGFSPRACWRAARRTW